MYLAEDSAFMGIISKIMSHQFVSLPFLSFSTYVRILEVQTSKECSLAAYIFDGLVWRPNCRESSFRCSLQCLLTETEKEHNMRKAEVSLLRQHIWLRDSKNQPNKQIKNRKEQNSSITTTMTTTTTGRKRKDWVLAGVDMERLAVLKRTG